MVSVLAKLAALVAIGLLFALDPGGAIADSGFPDYRHMDWKQLTAWGFRIVGVGIALLLALWLWIRYHPRRGPGPRAPADFTIGQRPGLPAAAVSVLEEREVSGRTLLAAMVEMCQRGTLGIECVATGSGFLYGLSQQGPAQFEWERLIGNVLPPRPATIQALHERLKENENAIGDRLGEYLQHRGLFRDNPIRARREHYTDGVGRSILVGVLMGVGGGLWLDLWVSQWWANSLAGAFIGVIYWLIASPADAGMLPPTEAGALEISQLNGLKASLTGPDPAGGRVGGESMLAYAIALDAAQPWLDYLLPAPPWFGAGEAAPMRASELDVAFYEFMGSPAWGLAGRSDGAVPKAEAQETDRFQSVPVYTGQDEGTAQSRGDRGTTYGSPETGAADPEPEADNRGSPLVYQAYQPAEWVEEPTQGRGCLGRFLLAGRLLALGVVVLLVVVAVVVVTNLVSPAVEPCPADSPPIMHHGQLLTLLDLMVDECVSVAGEAASREDGQLLVVVDRGDYLQPVRVIVPPEALEPVAVGGPVRVAGRIQEARGRRIRGVPRDGPRLVGKLPREPFGGLLRPLVVRLTPKTRIFRRRGGGVMPCRIAAEGRVENVSGPPFSTTRASGPTQRWWLGGGGSASSAAIADTTSATSATAVRTGDVVLDIGASQKFPGVGAKETAVCGNAASFSSDKPGRQSSEIIDPLFRCVQGYGVGQQRVGFDRVKGWPNPLDGERLGEGEPPADFHGPHRGGDQSP